MEKQIFEVREHFMLLYSHLSESFRRALETEICSQVAEKIRLEEQGRRKFAFE
jgi:hypothetical protein